MSKLSEVDLTLNEIDLTPLKKLFNAVLSDTTGYDIYLGGGYVRDLYFNALNNCDDMEPKDVDLFFVPNGGERKLPTIAKSYVNYDKSSSEIPDMEERGVDSVRGLFVRWLDTKDVQFIAYNNAMTQEELAADMDCNINQVMICIDSNERFATNDFIEGHSCEYIEMLHHFNFIRMGKRLARMSDKFPGYEVVGDWDLSEFAKRVNDHVGSFCDEEAE